VIANCRTAVAIAFTGALIVCASSFVRAQSEIPSRSVWDGIYSKEQAGRGAVIYQQECTRCHPDGPAAGRPLNAWNGRTADDLLEYLRTTMPQDGPGRLTRRNYLDVLAYTFKSNGFPAGTALGIESERLRLIRIEPKRAPGQVSTKDDR
jgi:mono/diheme cytochrome c family protein